MFALTLWFSCILNRKPESERFQRMHYGKCRIWMLWRTVTATTVNALWKSESAPRCRLRSIHCVCCLSEAVHSEVNLIIHVSRYSLSSIPSWRDPLAHESWPASSSCMERGRSQGSEPHLAQGWEIFVFMRMDRDAPRLSLLYLGKTVTPQSRDGKKKILCIFQTRRGWKAHSRHSEVLVLAALWGILHTHSLWTWQAGH